MVQLLVFVAAVGIVNLLFVSVQVLVFKLARFPVDQIGMGLPFLFKRRVNGVDLKLGPLPILAFVYSAAWKDAPRGTRALTAIAPWLVIGGIALALVGPVRGIKLEFLLWPRLIEGALDTERAHALIGAFGQLLDAATLETVGVVMALMAAMNLSPISGLAGGHVLFALLGIRPEDRAGKILLVGTLLLWFALCAAWLPKLLAFLAR